MFTCEEDYISNVDLNHVNPEWSVETSVIIIYETYYDWQSFSYSQGESLQSINVGKKTVCKVYKIQNILLVLLLK